MTEERYDLCIGRLRQMSREESVDARFLPFFRQMAEFALMIDELREEWNSGRYREADLGMLKQWNHRLYEDILPEYYEKSYANPSYAAEKLGQEYGPVLCALYAELRGSIVYVFEGKTEYLDILFELLIEIYHQFEEDPVPELRHIKDTIYWYASDYCDVFVADRIRDQIDPDRTFAVDLIRESDPQDLRYLYFFGEYISDNEWKTAKHLAGLEESVIRKMADVYTDGYREGFLNTGKDLSLKSTVNIRYVLGFERVVKRAIENFEAMGLKPVIYRAGVSMLTRRQQAKTGYYGGTANPQYEYDHRSDQAIFFDKRFLERKLEVIQTTYEHEKVLAAAMAGPAVIEMFGEAPFSPIQKEEALRFTDRQEQLSVQFDSRQSQIVNRYIPGDERSYTIIAYPAPEIGAAYEEIFDEVIRINTLDAGKYRRVQQKMIDVLDRGIYVHILGRDGNRTDLNVQLHPLTDPDTQTIFENCVADVNIPVGEVFTSPVLEGTSGVLHVKKVYLNELQYQDLELTFANGMIADYSCGNFSREMENKNYIRENILYSHSTLPMGEFAIGTNTTAYAAAKKYGIEDKLPILIAEKMGPHFAVGDTCYSWSEYIAVYNPDGKEIIARDNSISVRRKEDVSKAYFHCHTDITIPYEELSKIAVVTEDGEEIPILENGRFVLDGTEFLNEPLKNMDKSCMMNA